MSYLKYITYGLGLIMIVFGLFCIFYRPRTREERQIEQKAILHNSLSLKDKIDIINGKNSFGTSAIKSYFFNVKLIMAKMNKIDDYPKIKMMSFLLAIVGLVLSLAINNILLALIFIPVFAIIPFEYIKQKYRKYNKTLEAELETALSLITISYTRTDNFIAAVEECINTLPPNVKQYFEDFLVEVTTINANMVSALIDLKTKIENKTFQQWIDRVIICQNDRSSIPSLQNFVNEFADNRNIQNELDAEIFSGKVELYMMIGFVFVTPLVLLVMQKEAFTHLFNDTLGKITVFIALLLVVIVFFVGNKIAKPIKFRGNKE